MGIGFCERNYSQHTDDMVGNFANQNSFGISYHVAMRIDGKRVFEKGEEEWFIQGDFIGIGVIYQPNSEMECFGTLNGTLLGKTIYKILIIKHFKSREG